MDRELTVLERSLLDNINKKYGKEMEPMVQLTDDSEYGKPRGWVDSGILALNWLISGKLDGGYPAGRITEMDGDPGTGKSLLCEMAIKDPSLALCVYFDTEAAIDRDFLKFLGVDNSKILYQPIDTVEQLTKVCQEVLDTVIANQQADKKILMIIDSVALASTEKEMDPEGGQDMGYKARMLRKFFRVYARKIEKYNIALLATNHYTQKVGVTYGPSKVTTGGTALLYAASVRLDLKVEELELDKKLESLGASSVTLQARTEKNRCFSPKRKVHFVLDFEKGVHKFSGLFKILLDYGIGQKVGGWCQLPVWSTEQKFYAKDFPDLVEKNNLLPQIQQWLDEAVDKGADTADVEEEAMDEVVAKEEAEVEEADLKSSKKRK
jgi:RecA/RadA recombinase